jgi:GDPmannose 4,6-dehydratase
MQKKTAIITGITGQDGSFLAEFLEQKNYRVVGARNLKMLPQLIKRYRPNELYNLAGISSVTKSWEDPVQTFQINAELPIQLLELIRVVSPATRFFQASSAEIFGNTSEIITEKSNRFKPLSPYATSKLAAHMAVVNFREQYGLFAVNGILYNHISPRQQDYMVGKSIARGVARVALGLDKQLSIGNLRISRDWGYAPDYVAAMWQMLQQKEPHDLVVATGKNHTIAEFVAAAFKHVGIKNWEQYTRVNPELLRKRDVQNMRSSSRALRKIGWKPKVDFKTVVKIMVNYELEQLA